MPADVHRKRREYDADQPYYDLFLSWQRSGLWRPRVAGVLRELDRWVRPGARILDVGCAIGTFAVELARRQSLHVVALDFSTTALATASAHARHEGVADRVAFVASAAELIGLRGGSFEVIVAADVIEHLVDPDAFLHEAYRLLAPGGILLLETPNTSFRDFAWYPRLLEWADRLGARPSRILCEVPVDADYGHYHIALRSYPQLLEMCRAARFEIVRHVPFGWWLELLGLDRVVRAACRGLRWVYPPAAYYGDTDVLIVVRRPREPRR